jgi:phage/plasmid-like protein (TIGR03299 family)
MAHELTITNGKAEMAFVGETPWHGLGQQLKEDSTIEDWQFQAGMDWTINTAPVQYFAGDSQNVFSFNGQNVLYRSDNKMPLSVVSNRYKPVQPKEVLEFFRDLVAENGFKIHTAGTLRGGKRMWALAETGKFGEVCKGDGIGGFLLLSTSCDRTLATTARFTTVRVVCNNTLTAAVNYDVAHKVSFSHIQKFNHEVVKEKLCSAVESFGSFMEMAKVLQKQKMNIPLAKQFVAKLVAPMSQVKEGDIENNRAYKKIMALFDQEAKGIELVGNTKWGMLNAVTEYVDHHNPSRNQDARLDSAWFGTGDRMKARAVELLVA